MEEAVGIREVGRCRISQIVFRRSSRKKRGRKITNGVSWKTYQSNSQQNFTHQWEHHLAVQEALVVREEQNNATKHCSQELLKKMLAKSYT